MVQNILATEVDRQSCSKGYKRSNNRRRKRDNTIIAEQLIHVTAYEQSSLIEAKKCYQCIPTKIDVNVDELYKVYPIDIDLSDYQITRNELIDLIIEKRKYQIINNEVWDIIMDLTIGIPTEKGLKKISAIEYKERIDYLKYQSYFSDMYYRACEPFDNIIYPTELCKKCNILYCNGCVECNVIKDEDVDERDYFSEDSSDDGGSQTTCQ